jgi:hypothetical protein
MVNLENVIKYCSNAKWKVKHLLINGKEFVVDTNIFIRKIYNYDGFDECFNVIAHYVNQKTGKEYYKTDLSYCEENNTDEFEKHIDEYATDPELTREIIAFIKVIEFNA